MNQNNHFPAPPFWIDKFLQWRLPSAQFEEVQGDMHELYNQWVVEMGKQRANRMYALNAFTFVRPLPKRTTSLSHYQISSNLPLPDMLQKNLTLALRNLQRHTTFTFINVAGLATGMACCLIIFLFVSNEFSYDKHHQQYDRIYRMLSLTEKTGEKSAILPGAFYEHIARDIPGIQKAARFHKAAESVITYQNTQFTEQNFLFADKQVLDIFTLPLLKGNAATALSRPTDIFITQTIAKKYFGNADPIGKTIRYNHEYDFMVAGVLKDLPANSHFQADFLASITSLKTINGGILDDWDVSGTYYYLLPDKGADIKNLEQKLLATALKHNPTLDATAKAQIASLGARVYLQPLGDIRLYSADIRWDFASKGDIAHVLIFTIIALAVICIACFNFVNLTTANATKRAKEIGIKKVLGVSRKQLMVQFYGETFLLITIAWILALVLTGFSLPYFNDLAGTQLTLKGLYEPKLFLTLLGITGFILLLAGSYPAFYLSGLQPLLSLKNNATLHAFGRSSLHINIRQLLVISQFSIAIVLIVSSLLISDQIRLMTEKKLGFDKSQLLIINNPWDEEMRERYEQFNTQISVNRAIQKVAAAHIIPAGLITNYTYINPAGSTSREALHSGKIAVSAEFLEAIGAEFIAGRNFSAAHASDVSKAVILNEKAVKELGLTNPVGTLLQVKFSDKPVQVIGIVKDMQFESLHQASKPLVFHMESPAQYASIFVRVKGGEAAATLKFLEKEWKKLSHQWPFNYQFMDDRLQKAYQTEVRVNKLVHIFTAVVIIIASMGLFGLASFVALQRRKEIGIRKVLGASLTNIVGLLSADFLKLVLIANVLAWPLAYYAINRWLSTFAYQVAISPWLFLLAGIAALLIALLTIAAKAFKAAMANPVNSLRNE